MRTVVQHWPEYAIEAACVALFMVSAIGCAVLLQHPQSPIAAAIASPLGRRIPMGLAMGATAAALIYSPWGRRSGAHMNPIVTLTFLRLGKVRGADAAGYVLAQFGGAAVGTAAAAWLVRPLAGDPSINYVATMPGDAGTAAAFAGEAAISFVLMLVVLITSNTKALASLTGAAAACLVAAFIVVESPLSGMSMNPARTVGSALFAHSSGVWIYFTAPAAGMFGAAEVFVRLAGRARVRCAKLHHPSGLPCIFRCAHMETA